MEVFTDASRYDTVIGIGYVVRLDTKTVEGNRSVEGEFTSMDAEMLAILEGLRIASQHSREHITLYTDCDPVVEKLAHPTDWEEYTASFEWVAGKFESCEVENIPRSMNTQADRLAKEAAWE